MLKSMALRSAIVAFACAVSVTAYAIADTPKPVSVQAGELVDALEILARQCGVDIIYPSSQLKGLRTNGVSGTLETKEAFRKLIEGTPLVIREEGSALLITLPATGQPQSTPAESTEKSEADARARESDRQEQKGGKRASFWDRFRLTQAGTSPRLPVATTSEASVQAADDSNVKLEEIIVTAQRREQNVQDVPISISVLNGSTLDKASVAGVTEALNLVPGVVATVANQGGGTQIAMRGVGAAAPILKGSSPIGYYLDSVPFGLVKQAIAPDPDAYDLQRVEVLRGPQGTLYGANAEGGLVRLLTNDANLDEFEAKARATYSDTSRGGSNYRGDLAVNMPIVEGKLAARAVVGYQSLSGWVDSPIRNDINDGRTQNYRLKINAAPTEGLTIGLSAWASRDDRGAPSVSGDNGRSPALIPQPLSTDYDAYGFKIGYNFSVVSLSSMTSYLDYQNDGTLDIGGGVPLFTSFHSNVFAQEITLSSNLHGPWRYSAGVFYRDATDRRIQTIPSAYGADWSDGSRSYAVYGELGRRFWLDKLEWTLGVRYFHDDVLNKQNALDFGQPSQPLSNVTNTFSPTTPRAVLSWYADPSLTLYASYSVGFRSGAPQDPGVARTFPTFPPLRPDKLYNYEIGAKGSVLDDRLVFDTAVYYIKWRDVQQTLSVPFGPNNLFVAAYVNGESASGLGVDLGVTTRPIKGLSLGMNVSWNDLTLDKAVYSRGVLLFEKGDRLNFSSRTTLGALADYTFPLGGSGLRGRVVASANYSSEQHDYILVGTNRITNLGDSLLIARVSASVMGGDRWSAMVFVDNINNDYRGNPSASTVQEWAPRPRPRTAGIQMDYRF